MTDMNPTGTVHVVEDDTALADALCLLLGLQGAAHFLETDSASPCFTHNPQQTQCSMPWVTEILCLNTLVRPGGFRGPTGRSGCDLTAAR